MKVAALEDKPLPESLLGIARILGSIPRDIPRAELDRAEREIFDTLQRIAARERGETGGRQVVEVWTRDII